MLPTLSANGQQLLERLDHLLDSVEGGMLSAHQREDVERLREQARQQCLAGQENEAERTVALAQMIIKEGPPERG